MLIDTKSSDNSEGKIIPTQTANHELNLEQVGKTPGLSGMDRIIKPVVVALVQLIFGMVFSVCVSLPYSSKPLGFVYETDKLNSMNQVLKFQLLSESTPTRLLRDEIMLYDLKIDCIGYYFTNFF